MKITCSRLHDPRMYREEGYWFRTTHGVQPGSIPKDVEILEIKEAPGGVTYVRFDRFLTTEELKYYDMREDIPVFNSEAIQVDEDDKKIKYVISSEDMSEFGSEDIIEIMDQLTSDGFDVTDPQDLKMGLAADLGYDDSEIPGIIKEIKAVIRSREGRKVRRPLDFASEIEDWEEADQEHTSAKNGMIKATNASAASVSSASTISVDLIKSEVEGVITDYMISEGFTSDEVSSYSRVTVYENTEGAIVVEVGAELSYDGMAELSERLDAVVQQYDPESYFDMEDAGLITAYVYC